MRHFNGSLLRCRDHSKKQLWMTPAAPPKRTVLSCRFVSRSLRAAIEHGPRRRSGARRHTVDAEQERRLLPRRVPDLYSGQGIRDLIWKVAGVSVWKYLNCYTGIETSSTRPAVCILTRVLVHRSIWKTCLVIYVPASFIAYQLSAVMPWHKHM